MKICAFTGHRPVKLSFKYNESHPDCILLKLMLKVEIIKAIRDGYDYFISGMALGVDTFVAEIVLELKEIYPNIKLECAIPCAGHPNTWPLPAQERYYSILERADVVTNVSTESYKGYLMLRRDEYMTNKCSLLIAVFDGVDKGGTAHTINYAKEHKKDIIQINPFTFDVLKK